MPQEMNILCCYSCKMFQVHIVKKARKWQCKVCNEKQSVKQIFFQGSGKDCRVHVQRLNLLKANDTPFSAAVSEQYDGYIDYNASSSTSQTLDSDKATIRSKLAKYSYSPKKEEPFNVEDLSSEDISEVEDAIPGEKYLHNESSDDSCSSDRIIDDSDIKVENVSEVHEIKVPYSMTCNANSDTDQCDNLQDNKFNKDHNNVISIFESNDDLDDPLDF